jgi:hypothetical protein
LIDVHEPGQRHDPPGKIEHQRRRRAEEGAYKERDNEWRKRHGNERAPDSNRVVGDVDVFVAVVRKLVQDDRIETLAITRKAHEHAGREADEVTPYSTERDTPAVAASWICQVRDRPAHTSKSLQFAQVDQQRLVFGRRHRLETIAPDAQRRLHQIDYRSNHKQQQRSREHPSERRAVERRDAHFARSSLRL